MNNMQITLKSIKEMHRLEKRLTPSTAVTAVVGAVLPFINIIFSSKIIEALETSAGTNRLIMLISAAVLTNHSRSTEYCGFSGWLIPQRYGFFIT